VNETFTKVNGDTPQKQSPSRTPSSSESHIESPRDQLTVPEAKLLNGASSPDNLLTAVQNLEINSDRYIIKIHLLKKLTRFLFLRLSPGLTEPATKLKPPATLLTSEQQKSLTDTGWYQCDQHNEESNG
jgi:hypothetical protein